MRDFQSSTLWRISTFHAALESPDGVTLPDGITSSLMSGSLLSSLRRLQPDPAEVDLLTVVSVC
ncbi:MAG: hypothetical protein H7Z19_10255, partial [Chitinophagaceae bacterium]|nr:hypothetical protein [Rubrivivax sp.]